MRIHFIAIGGSAMHNLAIALKKRGYIVSGSDDEIFEPSKTRLANYGLLPEKRDGFPKSSIPNPMPLFSACTQGPITRNSKGPGTLA
jgi:UDP-N-acetylmuramate: L-alanyl-gamma-D-glutamyl-meso-diaminopimelate ligase